MEWLEREKGIESEEHLDFVLAMAMMRGYERASLFCPSTGLPLVDGDPEENGGITLFPIET